MSVGIVRRGRSTLSFILHGVAVVQYSNLDRFSDNKERRKERRCSEPSSEQCKEAFLRLLAERSPEPSIEFHLLGVPQVLAE